MSGVQWSPEERQEVLRLRRFGQTLAQIGKALNRPPSSINSCLIWLRTHAADGTAKTRPCLSCTKPFPSDGPHNRLCPRCASRPISPYAL